MGIELCKGVALVIDDNFDKGDDAINAIVANIKEKGIPVVGYDNLPAAQKVLDNLLSINFAIIDWQMFEPLELLEGVQLGSGAQQVHENEVCDFIKKLKSICFSPIFIFTNEDKETIIGKLVEKGIYLEEGRNFIFVKNKRDLTGALLFEEIGKWIDGNPSMYLLKKWEQSFSKAKNIVFLELYDNSNGLWPQILWDNFEKESEDAGQGLNDTIFRLIISETDINDINKAKIITSETAESKETKDLFRRIMYQMKDLKGIKPGDIFKDGSDYYLNIRPECDTVEGRWDKQVHLIKGKTIANEELVKLRASQYEEKNGLNEKVNQCFVYLIGDDDVIQFQFKKLTIQKYNGDLKRKRICRLLPPYITKIQQKYSAYVGRFGIPRFPLELEKEIFAMPAAEITTETVVMPAAASE